ncbi:MAG: anhydro-N-acetylmuramic acid kinase [Vampirovibrionales bacterium]|nr:anhydro-N-acetylmuramic acid kinase [Vampirovibrionales bacterium]
MTVEHFVGLMSGTSLDGVDGVVVAIEPREGNTLGMADSVNVSIEAHCHSPMPAPLKETLLHCQRGEPIHIQVLCALDNTLGEWFGDAAFNLLRQWGGDTSTVVAVGSHGQTVGHYPNAHASCQLGNPSVIATKTGLPVVSHFRQGDLAVGGQGAPLVPWVDAILYSHETVPRYLINIGGMANVTWVPPRSGYAQQPVWEWPLVAMDTGPGNVWMDAACQQLFNKPYDTHGALAAHGSVSNALLMALLQEATIAEFLAKPAPKSTGRDVFSVSVLEAILDLFAASVSPHDVVATLTHFTAQTIANGLQQLAVHQGIQTEAAEIWVTGGGAFNSTLMQALKNALGIALPKGVLNVGDPLGYPPQHKEPLAFALLAWARWQALPGNNAFATGATKATPLGAVWLPPFFKLKPQV